MKMNIQSEQSVAISLLTEKKVKALLSNEAQMAVALTELVSRDLSTVHSDILRAAEREYDLLHRHSHFTAPTQAGLYLKLLHGRPSPDCEMKDWGTDGPWIGPLKSFHCIYLSEIGMTFVGGEELIPVSPNETVVPPIYAYGQLIYYEGIYYGNFELHNI